MPHDCDATRPRLPGIVRNYREFAEDATLTNLPYDRFLLCLVEQETAQREHNWQVRQMQPARFPVRKELSDFDFSCVPGLSKRHVLELPQGSYLHQAESLLLMDNPGMG